MPKPLTHPGDKTLLQLSDGELSTREAAAAQAHLCDCALCRARLREIERLMQGVSAAQRTAGTEPEDDRVTRAASFRARLASAAVEPRETAVRGFFHSWQSAAAAAALAGFAVLALVFSSGAVNAEGPMPKSGLTPGETRPVTLREICAGPEYPSPGPDIPDETRQMVFRAYGMAAAPASGYEVDYLITPELGGAATLRNLWPEPYSARWNARVKDKLEQKLHGLVCQGKLDLATAQHDIATDWISAYRRYVDHDASR